MFIIDSWYGYNQIQLCVVSCDIQSIIVLGGITLPWHTTVLGEFTCLFSHSWLHTFRSCGVILIAKVIKFKGHTLLLHM